ncbi:MAG: Rrf2 family transcriptional regulator [Candidatus Delongbacteria bacterium]|jgi:Rrf2 family cysteine metabolism transcriptional repressor|nr:Rrf2 family transcriptional regulator [Candidatus Delongbacteria bacterium]
MKLTTKSEYSILALIYIARFEEGGFVKIEDICSKYNISKKYLENLLTVLKQNRLLKTRRGIHGGYKLARPSSEISIAEIVRLMDGALAAVESVSKYFYFSTPLEAEIKVINVFRDIRDYISDKLENVKISDLV